MRAGLAVSDSQSNKSTRNTPGVGGRCHAPQGIRSNHRSRTFLSEVRWEIVAGDIEEGICLLLPRCRTMTERNQVSANERAQCAYLNSVVKTKGNITGAKAVYLESASVGNIIKGLDNYMEGTARTIKPFRPRCGIITGGGLSILCLDSDL